MMAHVSKPKRPKSKSSRTSDRNRHLHVVVDDTLHTKLEAHARKLEGMSKDDVREPNLSAAARDAMRKGLGLPTVDVADTV
jgi:hypothetical protein